MKTTAVESGVSASATRQQRGIQSVEVGARLLQALAAARRPVALAELALAAELPAAQAYTYLVSFSRIGMVKRDPLSGNYEAGPLALRLGLLSLQQTPAYQAAVPLVATLAQQLGYSVAVCMAGARGPTIVRYQHAGLPLHVNLHIGSVMALENTSTGLLFCAYATPEQRQAMQAAQQGDLQTAPLSPTQRQQLQQQEQRLAEIRQHGMARSVNTPSPGVSSLCAPVFDQHRQLCLALTVIGASSSLDVAWDGAAAVALQRCAADISAALGGDA